MNHIRHGAAVRRVAHGLFTLITFLGFLLIPAFSQADPSYQWTATVGGSGTDAGKGVAVDGQGNIYQVGSFRGTVDFNPGAGVDQRTAVGSLDDIFITKTNADGSYGWTKTVGGVSSDFAYGVAADAAGNVFVGGEFLSSTVDFDPGPGVVNRTTSGGYDGFLLKLNADGSYGWVRTFGGASPDAVYAVAVDAAGNIFFTGRFNGNVNFNAGGPADIRNSVGGYDIFLTKLLANGDYGWTRTVGSAHWDAGQGVAVDAGGAAYITGYYQNNTDFDPGPGTDIHTFSGGSDVFVSKYIGDGSYGWTRTFIGSGSGEGKGVAVDGNGGVYVAGTFSSSVDFYSGSGTDVRSSNGGTDIFLTKLTTDGNYAWTRTVGGTFQDEGRAVVSPGSAGVLVSGMFGGTIDFDPGTGQDMRSATSLSFFLTSFQADGAYQWTRSIGGGTGSSVASAVAASASAAYITGDFSGNPDFDPGTPIDSRSPIGANDIFLSKYGIIPLSITIDTPPDGYVTNLAAQTISGHLSKPSTLTVNNVPLTVAADNSFTKNVSLSEGNNSFTFIATATGGETAQELFALVLDTQVPAAVQMGSVSVSEPSNGIVNVTGAAGSVEAGARVTLTNTRTGDIVMATANSLGAFNANIAAQGGDTLTIRVNDTAGNMSNVTSLALGSSIAIHIATPIPGTVFQTDRITVAGHYSGPINSGITINDVVASADNAGNFMATNIPLLDGSNSITATVLTLDGQSATDTVTVNNTYSSSNLELNASTAGGPVPLQVEFTYDFGTAAVTSELRIDFDGDGINDSVAGAGVSSFQHTYPEPGLYEAKLTLVDDRSQIHRASTLVHVISGSSMDTLFGEIWNGVNSALSSGNAALASAFLTTSAKEQYGPAFAALLPHMNEIIASYSPLKRVSLNPDIGEYAINRVIDGRNKVFLIYFIRGGDGIWRLAAM